MNTLTEKQMQIHDITHKHGGNGWAVCQKLDKDYVRLTPVMADPFGREAVLAATSLLSVSPHPPELDGDKIKKLAGLRKSIEAGKLKVVNQRILKA